MANTNVEVKDVKEEVTDVTTVEETNNSKKCLGKAGIAALVVAGAVCVFKLGKTAWNKWVKPGIQKRKAKKEVAKTDVIDVQAEVTE
jgi:hypothetical protein